jgi:hypothetical protein
MGLRAKHGNTIDCGVGKDGGEVLWFLAGSTGRAQARHLGTEEGRKGILNSTMQAVIYAHRQYNDIADLNLPFLA